MGHVGPRKDKLLDALRNANVVDKEPVASPSSIGALPGRAEVDGDERRITSSTPRSRGVHRPCVPVCAGDRHSRSSWSPPTTASCPDGGGASTTPGRGVPIVSRSTKIDKEDADPTKFAGQLTEYGLVPEEYGGDTMFVDVSAKSMLNLAALL
jgi:translation initiation factor IF-2